MSIQNALLALLADGPRHGYDLKARFEQESGGVWPLNIGQVYTTLQRLQRDDLVEPDGDPDDDRGRQRYRLTPLGRDALAGWFAQPAEAAGSARDELALKILFAAALADVELTAVIDAQRIATMRHLQSLGAERVAADPTTDSERLALLDLFTLRAEADLRWLDAVEARLGARKGGPR